MSARRFALGLAALLPIVLGAAAQTQQPAGTKALAPSPYGFASFDADIAICSKNEPGRRTEFHRRLDPVRACGRVDTQLAASLRASPAYKRELKRQLAAAAQESGSKAQIGVYCDTVLANVERFCARSMGPGLAR